MTYLEQNYTSILSIAPSHLDENIIWIGTDDGQVQLTKNWGKNWENLTSKIKSLPNEAWIAKFMLLDTKKVRLGW